MRFGGPAMQRSGWTKPVSLMKVEVSVSELVALLGGVEAGAAGVWHSWSAAGMQVVPPWGA